MTIAKGGLNGVEAELICETDMTYAVFPSKVAQVVNNLLVNAAHACEGVENPKIELVVSEREGRLHIVVQDNGPGVPEDLRTKIFDPFFTTKAVGKGTGLGLALCKRFAEEMGGRLELLDSSDGAAFGLTLEGRS